MNNQETNTHHSDDEADQKVDNLSSTEVPLLSEVELDEQVYVPSKPVFTECGSSGWFYYASC